MALLIFLLAQAAGGGAQFNRNLLMRNPPSGVYDSEIGAKTQERPMRWLIGGMAMWVLMLAVEPAAAQTYPWCAHYGGRSGAKNCGFVSFEQCRATVSGIGGHCAQNPFYAAGDVPRRVKKSKRRVRY